MNTDNFLLELKSLPYDRQQLLTLFEDAKPFARVKGLKWRDRPSYIKQPDQANCVVIQFGENMMLDNTKDNLSYDFLKNDYVKSIMNRLNFSHPITSGNIDIIWYRPGFKFEPHTDHYAYSTMMWPIIPEDGGAPVDFYYRDDIILEEGKPDSYENKVTEQDIIHTHFYSTEYPCIFNSHWIHGVRTVQVERAYLRLRINESFSSIRKKYLNGTLIND